MTISHEHPRTRPDSRSWQARLLVPEMWASLAIAVMWLAVLFDAVLGPDIVTSDGAHIPSAIVVALFAYLGTRVAARYGFRSSSSDAD